MAHEERNGKSSKRRENAADRRARLEQELRANLLKRKEQGRARKPQNPLTNREDRQATKE